MRFRYSRLKRKAKRLIPLTLRALFWTVVVTPGLACAQFTTVINSPPTFIFIGNSVDSNTQVNVNPGGSILNDFRAGNPNGTSSNVEVNIVGGSVGRSFNAFAGSKVNISGGTIGIDFRAWNGSRVNISGGRIHRRFMAMDGSVVNISGGVIEGDFVAQMGSLVTVSGGSIGDDFNAAGGSVVDILGGTFTRNILSGGIINFSGGNVLGSIGQSGGSLAMSGGSALGLSVGFNGIANISGGSIVLLSAGNGSNSTLSGGSIGRQLLANRGSAVTIIGGEFRLDGVPIPGLESEDSSVQVNIPLGPLLSGTLADGTPFAFTSDDEDLIADGTITLKAAALPSIGPPVISVPNSTIPLGMREGQLLVVSNNGALPNYFNAGRGSTTLVTSGTVGAHFEAVAATVIVTGGQIGDGFDAFNGSTLAMYGGQFGNSVDAEASFVDLVDGRIGAQFTARNGTIVNVFGGEIDYGFRSENGSQVNISGGVIKDNFTASGSTIRISGGYVGNFFWAHSDSTVHISGGTIGQGVRAGSRFDVYGGEFRLDGQLIEGLDGEGKAKVFNLPPLSVLSGILADGTPFAFTGSQLSYDEIHDGNLVLHSQALPPTGSASISVPIVPAPRGLRAGQTLTVAEGGVIADNFNASWGSTVNITGGEVGERFEAIGADITISGGNVGRAFAALFGSTINITGGRLGQYFIATRGAVINMSGGTIDRDAVAGKGSVFNISGGHINSSFSADEESVVNISGGFIDRFFRARNKSAVNITGGTLEDLDAFSESVVNISGGTIGYFSTSGTATISGGRVGGIGAEPGSVVSVSNVDADSLSVRSEDGVSITGGVFHISVGLGHGSVANISGGAFEGSLTLESGSTVNLFGGLKLGLAKVHNNSTVNVFGTHFSLDGVDITGTLIQNTAYAITTRDVPFSALLADGSPFQLDLRHSLRIGDESFDPNAILTVTLVLPGDFNVDGVVDAADYVVWRGSLGSTVSTHGGGADGNFDGHITQADYEVWRENFGQRIGIGSNGSAGTLVIPEPNCEIVTFLAALVLVSFGKRM
jgi:hypothetical protein